MNRLLAALSAVCGLVAIPAAHADTIPLGTATLAGGASFIAGDSRIKFDPNNPGETATFVLASVPDTQYVISITGQSNQSASFVQAFIDRDGTGPLDFVQLGSNINFGSGFETITLPVFTDVGTSDFLRLINGGTGNGEIQISHITVNSPTIGTPFPHVHDHVVGAGLPGLIAACGGLLALARRRRKTA